MSSSNIVDIIQSKFRDFMNPSEYAETLMSEALHPQEPVIWKSKPGRSLKPMTMLMLAMSGIFLLIGILSIMGFEIPINGSTESTEGWKVIGVSLLIAAGAIYMDRRDAAQSLYAITDRRVLACMAYDDDELKVHELEIRSNTTTSYNEMTKVLTIDTLQPSNGLRESVGNILKTSALYLENIDDPDDVIRLIQKIIDRQSKAQDQRLT